MGELLSSWWRARAIKRRGRRRGGEDLGMIGRGDFCCNLEWSAVLLKRDSLIGNEKFKSKQAVVLTFVSLLLLQFIFAHSFWLSYNQVVIVSAASTLNQLDSSATFQWQINTSRWNNPNDEPTSKQTAVKSLIDVKNQTNNKENNQDSRVDQLAFGAATSEKRGFAYKSMENQRQPRPKGDKGQTAQAEERENEGDEQFEVEEIQLETDEKEQQMLLQELEQQLPALKQNERNLDLMSELKRRRLPFQLFVPKKKRVEGDERRKRFVSQQGAKSAANNSTGNNNNNNNKSNQVSGYRTNVVIKAFNYKLRLNLELNNILFGPGLIQKHFLPKGGQQISTQKIEHCYYHARTQPEVRPIAIGAFRTCNGLSGVIHVNNESFVIHPFAELSNKHPHIIYRYQADYQSEDELQLEQQQQQQEQSSWRQCPSTRLHEWAFRKYNKLTPNFSSSVVGGGFNQQFKRSDQEIEQTADCNLTKNCDNHEQQEKHLFSKRDVSLTEKYIELALVLSQDMFDKRNSSSRLEVLHDAIQIVNCLDLYFRSANTRVALIYVETWAYGDQIELTSDVKQSLYNFLEYSNRKLYKVSMDAAHLLTGGHARQFAYNEMGMAFPDSICSSQAVSISQEAGIFEPFIAAASIAHMLGHNLGMEHDITPSYSGPSDKDSHPSSATEHRMGVDSGSGQDQSSIGSGTAFGTWRTGPAAGSQQRQPAAHSASSSSSDQDDHEDEIRSRSINVADESSSLRSQRSSLYQAEQNEEYCKTSNCLMSERLAYPQPPVSIGNMIQQQVATGSSLSGSTAASASATGSNQSNSMFTMFSSASSNSGGAATIVAMDQQGSISSLDTQQWDQQLASSSNQNNSSEHQHHKHPTRASLATLPFKFSRQSVETYHKLLRLGHGICLFNKPNQLEDFKTCGNGIVDQGEDCDCGTFQECFENDSCCDPITCRFKADAECITGACCNRCRLRAKGFVCRKSRGECDLAEQCDGKSSQCAPDVHKQNGSPCSSNSGYCYLGQCPSHDAQCADLWGSDARSSNQLCFLTFNTNGTIRGNCGYEPNSRSYKRCERDHLMCGTLQCQSGDMKPITAQVESSSASPNKSAPEFSKKSIRTHDGQFHECKVITGPASGVSNHGHMSQQAPSSIGYVRDGSKCAPNKVCLNQSCQPIEMVFRDSFELCPRDERGRFCSNNGVCSTANRCHCDPTWTGHDCSQRATANDNPNLDQTIFQSSQSSTNSSNNSLFSSKSQHLTSSFLESPAESLLKPLAPNTSSLFDHTHEYSANISSDRITQFTPQLLPATPTVTLSPESSVTPPAQVVPTEPPPATTTPSPPPQVASPSNVVQDKKKHDALGAPTLVFILVSIVAAVYVGFALMANCYRRKGFIKPDKVLRHHQMNCKLDAIRSSFIAKRLADAEFGTNMESDGGVVGNGNANNLNPGSTTTTTTNPSLAMLNSNGYIQNGPPVAMNTEGGLMNPFVSPNSSQAPTTNCQHSMGPGAAGASIYSNGTGENYMGADNLMTDFLSPTLESQEQQQQRILNQQQFAATVHYSFDKLNDHTQHQHRQQPCIHQQQRAANATNQMDLMNYEEHTADHIPLLLSANENPSNSMRSNNRRILGQGLGIMRSFNSQQQQQASLANNNKFAQTTANHWQHHHQMSLAVQQQQAAPNNGHQYLQTQHQPRDRQNFLGGPTSGPFGNRTTSLGDVNGRKHSMHRDYKIEDFEDEDTENNAHHRSLVQRTLATPLRSNRSQLAVRRRLSPPQQVTGTVNRRMLGGSTNRVVAPNDDYCSAPSSPEHRENSCWSETDRHRAQSISVAGYPLSRPTSNARLATGSTSNSNSRQKMTVGYHEDVILEALVKSSSRQRKSSSMQSGGRNLVNGIESERDDDEEEREMPPLPPPPATHPSHLHSTSSDGLGQHNEIMSDEHGVEVDGDVDDVDDDEDSETLLSTSQRHQIRQKQQHQRKQINIQPPAGNQRSRQQSTQEPTSAGSTMAKTVRRIPLNSGDNSQPAMSSIQNFEQLSLIAQLQQLERVQSLHQKQLVSSNDQSAGGTSKKLNAHATSEVGHEFFSLPLSVQLSALLARSLREDLGADPTMGLMNQLSVEDYLNNLNNSNVATSSRRSFKRSSPGGVQTKDQQQPGDTWGKRQQMKLQNLQSLINRLQKLHNQTMLQQQLDELDGELDEDLLLGSRQSTLSRSNRAKSVTRVKQLATGDEVFSSSQRLEQQPQQQQHHQLYRRDSNHESGFGGSNRGRAGRKAASKITRSDGHGTKNESVYSMSDSEDGAMVSRMLVSYHRKIKAPALRGQAREEDGSYEDSQEDQHDQFAESPQASSPVPPSPPPPLTQDDIDTNGKASCKLEQEEQKVADNSADSSASTNNQNSNV